MAASSQQDTPPRVRLRVVSFAAREQTIGNSVEK